MIHQSIFHKLIRRDRMRQGGGVAIYVKITLSFLRALDYLENLLAEYNWATHDHSVLIGDFNVDLDQSNSPTVTNLAEITSSFGLTQLVNSPTRITTNSSTTIDHVYVSDASICSDLSVTDPLGNSDHNTISVTLILTKPLRNTSSHWGTPQIIEEHQQSLGNTSDYWGTPQITEEHLRSLGNTSDH